MVPLPWLALALRLDGRLDLHPADEDGADKTGTGDPRVFLRAGYDVTRSLGLGTEFVFWFPGNKAPSFHLDATSVDFKALLAYRAQTLPLALLLNAGFRLDQSENSAPDLTRVRPGDRTALGVSAANAVLIGVGLSTRALARSPRKPEHISAEGGSRTPDLARMKRPL